MLVKIGEGGCRGQDWNRKGCPKLIGRVTLDACAKECRKSNYCTAFHVLKFDSQDGTHECLIFGHVNIIAVKSLGGECYTLVDTSKVEDEEEEEENQIGKQKYMYNLFWEKVCLRFRTGTQQAGQKI